MTNKHFGWHKRWVVNLDQCTATHDSGLIVRAERAIDGEAATDFKPVNLAGWQNEMLKTMPISNLLPHAQRLMKEAVQVYQRAQEDRH
jgi:hypothetical protein